METRDFENLEDFKTELISDAKLQDLFKADPVAAINQVKTIKPLEEDIWIYRIVVLALGLTILLIIIGIVVLMLMGKIDSDKGVPTILTAISSAAIGALAGLLAPSPTKKS